MKKTYILIALAMVAALSMVSCKNNNKNTQEPTQEEVQEQKQALADSVLSVIDDLAVKFIESCDKGDFSLNLVLTDEEKMVKPDYLLDPSLASTFVTKSQKITALAYLFVDYLVLSAYDMPLEATNEAIAKLAAEVNYPADIDEMFNDCTTPPSNYIKQVYNAYKERNDLAAFWKFQYGILLETAYVISNNPELYYKYINDETNAAINEQWVDFENAVKLLAPYDEEISSINNLAADWFGNETEYDINEGYESIESAIATYKEYSDKYAEFRNLLLE